MKFGHLETNKLTSIDLSLPEDASSNTKILGGKKSEKVDIFLGCAKWGRDEWIGMIYPEGTNSKDFLKNYVHHFNSIELNATFYNAKKNNIINWATIPGNNFRFCPKFPQRISHIKRLKEVEDFTEWFMDAVTAFGKTLGLPFLQMPDNFSPKFFDRLKEYIEKTPKSVRYALELRHSDWFTEKKVFSDLCKVLEDNDVTLIITDTAGRRDCVHQSLTTKRAFIRFIGYDLHPTDYTRMDEWALRIRSWIENGIEELYFFLHQENEKYTPVTADYMIRKLNEECSLDLSPPTFLDKKTGA